MTETVQAPSPKKRGPSTPEGKARSRMNALKHGLRAREFGLLPEESQAEWAQHLAEVRGGLGPADPFEEKLSTAVAVAMWLEIRADRVECDVMAEIPPLPQRYHGGDLQEARHAASLGTAIRYRTGAGMATQRAQRAFYAYRKARRDGLVPEAAAVDETPPAADAFPAVPDAPAAALQETPASFATDEAAPGDADSQICGIMEQTHLPLGRRRRPAILPSRHVRCHRRPTVQTRRAGRTTGRP